MAIDVQVEDKLKSLIRNTSLSRLQHLSQLENLEIAELADEPRVFAHWMSFALLSGKNLRVVFKAHFMTDTAKFFAGKIYRDSKDKIKNTQAVDFFKEFCGLTVGQLKAELSKSNVKVGISLPGLIRGFDEVFYKRPKGGVHHSWVLKSGEWNVSCSAEIELFDNFVIEDVPHEDESNLGDVDYL